MGMVDDFEATRVQVAAQMAKYEADERAWERKWRAHEVREAIVSMTMRYGESITARERAAADDQESWNRHHRAAHRRWLAMYRLTATLERMASQ